MFCGQISGLSGRVHERQKRHERGGAGLPWPWVDPTNPHRLAETRSRALHREVARRVRERPELLDEARARVEGWLRDGSVAQPYARAWCEILSSDLGRILDAIVDPSERGRDLRQCSPFAGILDARTRWRILDELREGSAP